MDKLVNIGVIGYGYWGPNLVRNFAEIPLIRVKTVCDLNPHLFVKLNQRYPAINFTTKAGDIFQDPEIDAVVIATPVFTHFDLAMAALQAGKHTLVEKPLTTTPQEAEILIYEAQKRNLILMVDHTFVYTGAVGKIKEIVEQNLLGDIYYYDSVRINLGLFQSDVNVLWDLAVHDLAIMDYVLNSYPYGVSATGISHIANKPENIAYMTLFFEKNMIAHIHVNWLAPVKLRRTLIGGSQKMLVFDDLEPSEKLKIYDKGIMINNNPENQYQFLVGYRTGDIWLPKIDTTEALFTEAQHFINCIEQNEQPITDGKVGLRIVKILEGAKKSMAQKGRLIELNLT
jgi:predicted dehydrogenase